MNKNTDKQKIEELEQKVDELEHQIRLNWLDMKIERYKYDMRFARFMLFFFISILIFCCLRDAKGQTSNHPLLNPDYIDVARIEPKDYPPTVKRVIEGINKDMQGISHNGQATDKKGGQRASYSKTSMNCVGFAERVKRAASRFGQNTFLWRTVTEGTTGHVIAGVVIRDGSKKYIAIYSNGVLHYKNELPIIIK